MEVNGVLDVGTVLADQRASHPDDVGDLLCRAGAGLGTDVTLYLVDFGQVVLQPVPNFAAGGIATPADASNRHKGAGS